MPCVWNRGSLVRDPGQVLQKKYDSFQVDVQRRANFDPRPTAEQTVPRSRINDFLASLSGRDPECQWSLLMSIKYEEPSFTDDDFKCFRRCRDDFIKEMQGTVLALPLKHNKIVIEFPDTTLQGKSDSWLAWRRWFPTSSCARQIDNMSSVTRKDFLRRHLWQIEAGCKTNAMLYGQTNEENARKKYELLKKEKDKSVKVVAVGLITNKDCIGIAGSPDGFVTSDYEPMKLLEIKCPYMLRNHDPNKFETVLSKDQLSRFCLTINNGEITLKRTHQYYDQVQVMMGLAGLASCDFFVWSPKGEVTARVPFDKNRWDELRESLMTFYRTVLVVDYIVMKTPRKLSPLQLD
ncbi:hypothetical protein FOCC_FOCC013700 [Frankliniella occidentalis]|nr:hypothetical protein FOCC_FOCC013700 [Frankliniella occidentalis]